MTEEGIVLQKDELMTIGDHYDQYLDKLQTYEDYLSFYSQLDEASSAFSWVRADVLLQMVMNLGDKSVEELAKDLKQPRSTVTNYVRVARAFPPDKREPIVPFSTHYQASYADSYNEKTKVFDGELRFELIKKAADDGLSVRQVIKQMQETKALKSAPDEDTARMIADAEQKAHDIMKMCGSLRDDVKTGNKQSYESLFKIHEFVFPH
jgi:hypothetical protein